MTKAIRLVLAVAVLVAWPFSAPAGASPDPADAVQVSNRDVFVVVGASLRNPDAGTDPSAPLFTNSGIALDLTWGEWSAASAASRASVVGGPARARTDVRLVLRRLVPGGLYSVFWGTLGPDSEHPLCQNVERTLPLDAFPHETGPTPNSFVADAAGAANFRGRTGGDLLEAAQVFFTVVYHFYGDAPYPFPNLGELLTKGENCRSSFGEDSMRHVLILQKW